MVHRNLNRRHARLTLQRLEDRLTPSTGGVLDPSFGSGGTVQSSFVNYIDEANAVVVQPDGKTVIAGRTQAANSKTGDDFLVARYSANGTLDTSFGTGGFTATDFNKSTDDAYAVALQPQSSGADKILVAGLVTEKNGTEDFGLARFNANGTVDTTFGTSGKVDVNLGGNGYAESMTVDSLGRIVLGGFTGANADAALVRFTANGVLDTTFGTGGKVVSNIVVGSSTRRDAIALLPDGKIVLATTDEVARFNTNGTIDTGFGTNGLVATHPGTNDHFGGVTTQPDSEIVSESPSYSPHAIFLVRYTSAGALDSSFGTGGIATLVWPGAVVLGVDSWGSGVAVEGNGDIVAAAITSLGTGGQYPIVVARVNPNGGPDTDYGTNGWATVQAGTGNYVTAISLGPDGRLTMAGYARTTGSMYSYGVMVARLLESAPQAGSFTASANPVASGSSETLTVSGITDGNPNATISQVEFYYIDGNGTQQVLGYGTQTSPGVWTLTSNVDLSAGGYTVYAQAEDSYDVFGDPTSLSLQVV